MGPDLGHIFNTTSLRRICEQRTGWRGRCGVFIGSIGGRCENHYQDPVIYLVCVTDAQIHAVWVL